MPTQIQMIAVWWLLCCFISNVSTKFVFHQCISGSFISSSCCKSNSVCKLNRNWK